MRTLTYDAGMLKAVLDAENITVLKNRFLQPIFYLMTLKVRFIRGCIGFLDFGI